MGLKSGILSPCARDGDCGRAYDVSTRKKKGGPASLLGQCGSAPFTYSRKRSRWVGRRPNLSGSRRSVENVVRPSKWPSKGQSRIHREHTPIPTQASQTDRQTYFRVRYSSIPYFDPSRPMPEHFTPPKGASAVEMRPVFTPTIPYSSASATFQTRLRSLA